ncbi:MAG: hypothetical protein JXO22_14640, partial [Phycisphaerae bacterium]|nr:hypothetical protein [Phycisphaerae bacterium]
IGAWLIAGQSAQAAPLDAYVDGDQIAVELDSVQAAADLKIEIVLRVVTSGDVTLEASVSSTEQPAPATAEADASVNVEDEYWEVVNTVTPIGACGMFGLVTPLLLTFGLLAMKRHHHRL